MIWGNETDFDQSMHEFNISEFTVCFNCISVYIYIYLRSYFSQLIWDCELSTKLIKTFTDVPRLSDDIVLCQSVKECHGQDRTGHRFSSDTCSWNAWKMCYEKLSYIFWIYCAFMTVRLWLDHTDVRKIEYYQWPKKWIAIN